MGPGEEGRVSERKKVVSEAILFYFVEAGSLDRIGGAFALAHGADTTRSASVTGANGFALVIIAGWAGGGVYPALL